MPPTRRKSANPHAQQTLTFGPHSNKVTKPSIPTSSKNLKASPAQLSKALSTEPELPAVEDIKPTETKEEVVEIPDADRGLAFRVQGKPQKDEIDEKARKVPTTQVKAYWKAKEDERKAPRGMPYSPSSIYQTNSLQVHQQGLTLHEKVLRHFDLSSQYGPCIGIARMKRWKRAQKLGLRPPIEVLAVLLKEEEGGGGKKSERAYVDELMSTRLVVE